MTVIGLVEKKPSDKDLRKKFIVPTKRSVDYIKPNTKT
jgi:DNA-binding MarR family transcriptional regulator